MNKEFIEGTYNRKASPRQQNGSRSPDPPLLRRATKFSPPTNIETRQANADLALIAHHGSPKASHSAILLAPGGTSASYKFPSTIVRTSSDLSSKEPFPGRDNSKEHFLARRLFR